MAVWTDCQGGPNAFGEWAADMGLYIGPWPILTPGELTGLDVDDAETGVQFVLGLPNPAHPGDPYYALDGTYDSPIWFAYRFLTGNPAPADTEEIYVTSASGAAPVPGPGDVPPAGVHLWVVSGSGVSEPLAEPLHPPEFYVPATYAAGGASALQTIPGGWSAWQTGLDFTDAVPSASGSDWDDDGDAEFSGSLTDIVPLAQTAVDTILGRVDTVSGPSEGGGLFDVTAQKTIILGRSTAAAVQLDQRSVTWSPPSINPDPLGALVFGVDYGIRPFADAFEYESADPATYLWGPDYDYLLGGSWGTSPENAAVGIATPAHTIRVDILADPITVGTTGLVAGDQVDTFTATPNDPTWDTPGNEHTFTLPGDLPLTFTVAIAPEMAYTGVYDTAAGPDFSNAGGRYSWDVACAIDIGDAANPGTLPFAWTTTQWRYWRPNTIGPAGVAWHTVGGHFRTVGGATLRILTPGVGWVPVLDGPAF